jgi:hypothetical protein
MIAMTTFVGWSFETKGFVLTVVLRATNSVWVITMESVVLHSRFKIHGIGPAISISLLEIISGFGKNSDYKKSVPVGT